MQDLLSIPLSEFNSLSKILNSKSTASCTFQITLLVMKVQFRWLDVSYIVALLLPAANQLNLHSSVLCYSLLIYINPNKFNLNTLYISLSLFYIEKICPFVFKKNSLAALLFIRTNIWKPSTFLTEFIKVTQKDLQKEKNMIFYY
jgi:hypothetical protein